MPRSRWRVSTPEGEKLPLACYLLLPPSELLVVGRISGGDGSLNQGTMGELTHKDTNNVEERSDVPFFTSGRGVGEVAGMEGAEWRVDRVRPLGVVFRGSML